MKEATLVLVASSASSGGQGHETSVPGKGWAGATWGGPLALLLPLKSELLSPTLLLSLTLSRQTIDYISWASEKGGWMGEG